jgi:hypothetical protein
MENITNILPKTQAKRIFGTLEGLSVKPIDDQDYIDFIRNNPTLWSQLGKFPIKKGIPYDIVYKAKDDNNNESQHCEMINPFHIESNLKIALNLLDICYKLKDQVDTLEMQEIEQNLLLEDFNKWDTEEIKEAKDTIFKSQSKSLSTLQDVTIEQIGDNNISKILGNTTDYESLEKIRALEESIEKDNINRIKKQSNNPKSPFSYKTRKEIALARYLQHKADLDQYTESCVQGIKILFNKEVKNPDKKLSCEDAIRIKLDQITDILKCISRYDEEAILPISLVNTKYEKDKKLLPHFIIHTNKINIATHKFKLKKNFFLNEDVQIFPRMLGLSLQIITDRKTQTNNSSQTSIRVMIKPPDQVVSPEEDAEAIQIKSLPINIILNNYSSSPIFYGENLFKNLDPFDDRGWEITFSQNCFDGKPLGGPKGIAVEDVILTLHFKTMIKS